MGMCKAEYSPFNVVFIARTLTGQKYDSGVS